MVAVPAPWVLLPTARPLYLLAPMQPCSWLAWSERTRLIEEGRLINEMAAVAVLIELNWVERLAWPQSINHRLSGKEIEAPTRGKTRSSPSFLGQS